MPRKTEDFLDSAYGLASLEEAMTFYREWAGDYDRQMESELKYVAPRQCAEQLAGHLKDTSASIIDIGCGTGLTAHYLNSEGFGVLDGIDLSDAMLDEARKRSIYRTLMKADLMQPLDLEDAVYDAAISSGTFTLGHVGVEPIPEIFRILKPGALFACTVHRDIWLPMGFAETFESAERTGQLEIVEKREGRFFADHEPAALYCLFRKLRTG